MAQSSTRLELERLNRGCAQFCREYRGNPKWTPFGDPANRRHANFRLLYSSPETFETPGGVMILGTNPGGDHRAAKEHKAGLPFWKRRPGRLPYSAYLDDVWGGAARGRGPIQCAVQSVAEIISGRAERAELLLRSSPTGNLIPFRSKGLTDLPSAVADEGLKYGERLIEIAQPRVLILIASRDKHWDRVMRLVGHAPEPDWKKDLGAHHVIRESERNFAGDWPRFVFALPGLNNTLQTTASEVLSRFRERVEFHGRTKLLGRAGIGVWR